MSEKKNCSKNANSRLKEKFMESKELVILYTVKDIQTIFKCGRKKSYEIMNAPGFPSFRINTSLYVEKTQLEKWIARNKNNTVIIV